MSQTAKVRTWSGKTVSVNIDHGRDYKRRVELSCDGRTVVYGIRRGQDEPVAECIAIYDDESLIDIGGDTTQPDWVDPALAKLDITEVRI